jgi:uncharacterized protein YndB with AHSA1/START domain
MNTTVTDRLGTYTRRGELADMRFERRYPRAIETVWAALTVPERLADWMGPARVEPRLGGAIELMTDRTQPMVGRILAWEPPLLLEFSWTMGSDRQSVARYELSRDGAGTRMVFTQTGVGYEVVALMLPGWHHYWELLGQHLAGTPQALSWDRWRALQAAYVAEYGLEGTLREAGCANE